jgi:hypothetical protein
VVPSSRRLLLAIERLVVPAHQLRVSWVNKTGRLAAVDCLEEGVMEEGVLDIQLVHRPTSRKGQSQNGADGGRLHHKAKSIIIVHNEALGETSEDPMCLVPVQSTIYLKLVLEDPKDHGTKS